MDDSQATEPVLIEVFVEINGKSIDDTVEVPRDEWQSMKPPERYTLCQSFVEEHLANVVPDAGYTIFGEDAGSELD